MISNEMLKFGGDLLQKSILHLFNIILKSGTYPKNWKTSLITPIHKSLDINNPANYRGVAVADCISKLFCKILNNRIIQYLKNKNFWRPNQNGFMEERRTDDNVMILHTLFQKYIKNKKQRVFPGRSQKDLTAILHELNSILAALVLEFFSQFPSVLVISTSMIIADFSQHFSNISFRPSTRCHLEIFDRPKGLLRKELEDNGFGRLIFGKLCLLLGSRLVGSVQHTLSILMHSLTESSGCRASLGVLHHLVGFHWLDIPRVVNSGLQNSIFAELAIIGILMNL